VALGWKWEKGDIVITVSALNQTAKVTHLFGVDFRQKENQK
jgi:hypothetical protein